MADLSTCKSPTCAYTVEGDLETCPRCGGPMRAVRESRARGWVLLLIGLFLIGMMGAITWSMAPSLMSPGEGTENGTWTGTADQARMVLGLFGLLIAFGFASAVNGVFQIVTGRQSKVVTALGLLVAAGVIVIVYLTLRDMK